MTKNVLDIGNCDPDHNALKRMLTSSYDVNVLRAAQLSDSLEILRQNSVDLILINRKLDIDYSDGMDVLKYLKRDASNKHIPVMIITNYPDYQQSAVADGAEYGFGKLQFAEEKTHAQLSKFLDGKSK